MSNLPPSDFGAHGAKQTPTGCAGRLTPCDFDGRAVAGALGGPGTQEGTTPPAAIPEQFRAGAFTPDLSVREYTGNPRDDGDGETEVANDGNRPPVPNARYQGGAT